MDNQKQSIQRSRIEFLDYMRIFAFSSVLLGHKFLPEMQGVVSDSNTHITIKYLFEALLALSFGGAAGVVVFFLTSGYIITHVLRVESSVEFAIKRVFRIYPLYMVAVILEVLMNQYIFYIPSPPITVILQRLFLVGDFFDTPYGLASVEWTLRIEVAFYAFMIMVKSLGLINKPKYLPAFFMAVSIALYFADPFPSYAGWTDGYTNIFLPMLFVGSIIYLYERKLSPPFACIVAASIICFSSLSYMGESKPYLRDSNFLVCAVGIFILFWAAREKIVGGKLITILSEITFGVYLFHNWLWLYFEKWLGDLGFGFAPIKLQVVIALFLFCYIAHRTVETYGVRLGRMAVSLYRGAEESNRKKSFATD